MPVAPATAGEDEQGAVEIADYLKVARRSLWVLLVVPLGAAMLAGVIAYKAPPTYQATVTVDLPLGDGKSPYAGSHGQVLYVDDFRNAVGSDPVITTVAEQTGVDEKKLTAGLQVKQVDDSSVMVISYTSPKKDLPPVVVQATANATLDRILQTQYDASQPALQEALDARQPLLDQQAALAEQTGGISPDNAIRAVHMEINSLKRQQHNLEARGISPSTLEEVEKQLRSAQATLASYRPLALEYQRLKTELNAANQAVTKQSQVVQAIRVLQKAAESDTAVTVTPAKRKAKLPGVMSATVAAAGAGAFLALGIIAVMELVARRRRLRVETAVGPLAPPAGTHAGFTASADEGAGAGAPPLPEAPAPTARRRRRPWARKDPVPPVDLSTRISSRDSGAGTQPSGGTWLPLKQK